MVPFAKDDPNNKNGIKEIRNVFEETGRGHKDDWVLQQQRNNILVDNGMFGKSLEHF